MSLVQHIIYSWPSSKLELLGTKKVIRECMNWSLLHCSGIEKRGGGMLVVTKRSRDSKLVTKLY